MPFNTRDNPEADSPSKNAWNSVSEGIKRASEYERIKILEYKVEDLSRQLNKTIKEQNNRPAERVKGLWFTEGRPPYFKKRHEPRRYGGQEVWWCGTSNEGPCNAWGNHKPSKCPHLNELTSPNILKKTNTKRKATSATTVELPNGKICHSPHKMIKRSDVSDKNKQGTH